MSSYLKQLPRIPCHTSFTPILHKSYPAVSTIALARIVAAEHTAFTSYTLPNRVVDCTSRVNDMTSVIGDPVGSLREYVLSVLPPCLISASVLRYIAARSPAPLTSSPILPQLPVSQSIQRSQKTKSAVDKYGVSTSMSFVRSCIAPDLDIALMSQLLYVCITYNQRAP